MTRRQKNKLRKLKEMKERKQLFGKYGTKECGYADYTPFSAATGQIVLSKCTYKIR